MGNVFSSSKKPKVTDNDRAVLALKTERRKLTDYQKQLDGVIKRELEAAREYLQQKMKEKALRSLKRKKAQEELLKKVDVWIMNVEQMLADIETAGRQKAVFDSLKVGQKAIRDLQKDINVEDIKTLMDESEEAKAHQDEVDETLGQPADEEDDEELLAELDNLEFEMDLQDFPEAPRNVPEVPVPAEPASPEMKPLRSGRVLEEPISDPPDGLSALMGRSERSAAFKQGVSKSESSSVKGTALETTSKEGSAEEELDLPSVPTSRVNSQKTEDAKTKSSTTTKKEKVPLAA